MKVRKISLFVWSVMALVVVSCTQTSGDRAVVNVYSHRHYDVDQDIFDEFEKETGIKVNVVSASADELIVRMKSEGERSPADVLITSDASRLFRAYEEGLLQSATSPLIEASVPSTFRDPQAHWIALTVRARVIVYSPERVNAEELDKIEDLTDEKWKGRLLMRSSSSEYNQSLLASLIANLGDSAAEAWAAGIVANMAREPRGNDRDQIKAIATGEGDLAVVNTYYLAKMLNSDNEAERRAAEQVKIFFPNSNDRGSHVNISGAGVTKHAPNRANAIRLLEYLTSSDVQARFAEGNYEYPVNQDIQPSALLKSFGKLNPDRLPLVKLGEHNRAAVEIFNRVGWN